MITSMKKNRTIIAAAALGVLLIAAGIATHNAFGPSVERAGNVQLSDSVVAVVGRSYITGAELRNAFETAYPSVKSGVTDRDRLYSVLAGLIAEKMLAEDARRFGYQTDERIAQLTEEFERMYLVEQVITNDVDARISVSDDEAREETMKSLVAFRFRYWMEPTRERAERVREMMRKDGFGETVAALVRRNPELKGIAPALESDYLRWTEIDPAFFAAIKDLPIGGVSVPVEHDGAFYLLNMEDIRRSGITAGQMASALPSSKKVVFARKRMAARKAYVASMMEPKQVKTNGEALRILIDAVEEWHALPAANTVDFFTAAERAGAGDPKLRRYMSERSRTMVTTTDARYSIESMARVLPLRKIMSEYRQPYAGFVAYTGAAVRDEYLKQRGIERGYDSDPGVKDRLRMWSDKWLYEEYRKRAAADGGDTSRSGRQGLRRSDMERLVHTIESLMQSYPVSVNKAVVDTMHVSEPLKSRGVFVSIARGGTDAAPLPLVGMEWQQELPRLKELFGFN